MELAMSLWGSVLAMMDTLERIVAYVSPFMDKHTTLIEYNYLPATLTQPAHLGRMEQGACRTVAV